MKKWNIGAYIRVSRDSEYSESDSLENQLIFIENYCIVGQILIDQDFAKY